MIEEILKQFDGAFADNNSRAYHSGLEHFEHFERKVTGHDPIANEIASQLIRVLNLPQGSSLVHIFGDGYETSNLDALTTWVNSNLHEINPEETLLRLRNSQSFQGGNIQGEQHASI